jgi:subtilisin family serine protease
VVESAIKMAEAKGVFVVASTGNSGDTQVIYPAADAKGAYRLSVTSVDLHDLKSDFATYGKAVEIAAPGENIYGPAPEEHLAAWSGTSMAAPMVSGALALALGEPLSKPVGELSDQVMNRAADLYHDGLNRPYKNQLGKGRLDLFGFLQAVIKYK